MNNRIKALRKALNLSQSAFGARIGVSGPTVAIWERGGTIPRKKIAFICSTFQASQKWMETGDGRMFESSKPNGSSESDFQSLTPYEFALHQGFSPRLAEFFQTLCNLPQENKDALDYAIR